MTKPSKRTIAVASAALLTFAGGTYAVAGGSAPTAITSSVTDQLGNAITAKYPGSTIVGIHSNPGGSGFVVEVRKSDGTEVRVAVDGNYKVGDELKGGPGRGGPGRGHGGLGPGLDTAALAKTLGVSESDLTAAITKVRQDKPAQDERIAAIAKALGASTSDVQAVFDDVKGSGPAGGPPAGGPPARGPGRGGPEARDELVSALAKKTGKSESDVRAALKAARPQPGEREDAIASALAKALGLDASKVKSALEAQRPKPDAAPATTPSATP